MSKRHPQNKNKNIFSNLKQKQSQKTVCSKENLTYLSHSGYSVTDSELLNGQGK
jgi:hypothetical protein